MNVKVTGNKIQINHTFKKGETYKFSKSKKFESVYIFLQPQNAIGIASTTECNREVLFFDYDNCTKALVEKEYFILQKEYNLPPGLLFATKEEDLHGEKMGNYHIISLIKLYPNQVYEILSRSHVDAAYTPMALRRPYRNWVLRISPKKHKTRPKFLQVIGGMNNLDVEISKAHLEFLKKIYPIPDIPFTNIDNSTKILIQEYETYGG